jgi:hypothetical protein
METMAKTGRVLIGIVTSEYKKYCEDDFIKQLSMIPYPDYEIIIVDNSYEDRTEELSQKLLAAGRLVTVERDVWCANVKARIMTSYNKVREYFLKGNYEFLLIIESDIFVKDWTFLKRWVELDKPVILGVYPLYSIMPKISPADRARSPKDKAGRSFIFSNSFRRGSFSEGRFWARFWSAEELKRGTVKLERDTGGFSMGLILFYKDVLKHFAFKYGHTTPDGYLKSDCDFHRIDTYADTDLEIEHRDGDWNSFVGEEKKLTDRLRYGEPTFQRVWGNEHETEEEELKRELEYNEEP